MELSKLTIDNLLNNKNALETARKGSDLLSKIRPSLYRSLGRTSFIKMVPSLKGLETGFNVDLDLEEVLNRVILTVEYMIEISDNSGFVKLKCKLEDLDISAYDKSDNELLSSKFARIDYEFSLSEESDYIVTLVMHNVIESLSGKSIDSPKDTYIIK